MNRLKIRTDSGFTLLELLVVIAVVGMLAAIAVPQFAAYRRRGFDTDVKSNIANATIAEEAYYTQIQTYTSSLADLVSWGFKQSAGVNIAATGTATTFIISAGATVGCSANTGVWSFASSAGVITGVTCN